MKETKTCQNNGKSKYCMGDFEITPDDFTFYEKINVPPPTFCPTCRLQRRLSFHNLINLFYRDCDLCNEQFISMYPKGIPYTVYCPKCWWSDKWSFVDYTQEYDFSESFFIQFSKLFKTVPLLGLSINSTTTVGSPYNNHAANLKDCYLTFNSDFSQECGYGTSLTRSRESFDSSMVMDTDSCYDCMCIYKSNKVIGTRGNNRFCIDCAFVRDCENCQDCFMCSGLKNKKYYYKNKEYTKEEYEKIRGSYNLGSYEVYKKAQKEVEDFYQTISPRPVWDTLSVNYSGSYVFHSKNCYECYDVVDSEDCKYCMMLWRKPQKNCYDVSGFGYGIETIYEGETIGEFASSVKFSTESGIHLSYAEYCKLALGGMQQFGCVSAKKGEYCILNKKYSKEEYFSLVEKIKNHMVNLPYVDITSNRYQYGEFFPMELSPFPYNVSFAELFFPLSKEEILNSGLCYHESEDTMYSITKKATEIPDSIQDAPDDCLKEVYECVDCKKGYKVIEMELVFLCKMNVPFPRQCPFCRIKSKLLLWVDNMKLKDRICNICSKEFKTHFGKDRAAIIFCKECYQESFS